MAINHYAFPADWRRVKLGNVCLKMVNGTSATQNSIQKGLPVTRIETISSGIINLDKVGWVDASKGSLEKYILVPGDILFSHINSVERLGNCAIYIGESAPLIHGINLLRIQVNRSIVDPTFLFFFFRSNTAIDYFRSNARRAIGQASLNTKDLSGLEIPLPPLPEQLRIVARLNEQMAAVAQARRSSDEQLALLKNLVNSYLRTSLETPTTRKLLSDCLVEIKKGVGKTWQEYPVIGATRAGVAPAKEKVGKQPERYKLVEPGTILYNPMRINIGSIAMLDDGDKPGITSPDYVVFKSKEGIIHPRWFYYWFRSPYGEAFINTLTREAVRERMLFNRLGKGEVDLPSWEIQRQVAEKLKEIKALKRSLDTQLAEINRLPSALLKRVFSGGSS